MSSDDLRAGVRSPPPPKLWPWLLGAVALGLFFVLLPSPGAVSSALSKESGGWWALRAYLEAQGVEVELLDAPLGTVLDEREAQPSDRDEPAVLVLALPWQRRADPEFERQLRRHLRGGGRVLLAYDGAEESATRSFLFDMLGLSPEFELRSEPPLTPRAWWRYQQETFTLKPADGAPQRRLEIPAFYTAPTVPLDAEVLYTTARSSEPVIFEVERHGGLIWALPAAFFANAHLAEYDHIELVALARERLGDRWLFDEYHHGLLRPELAEAGRNRYAWDLFIGHLLLIYALALLALGRRFGPTWREETLRTGSASDFLRSLGVLHHQLGHHRDAARRLLERTRQLAPGLELPSGPGEAFDPEAVDDGASLTEYAARLAERRGA
ncbi:MAG: DUF4350 domain-containing protein [Acidobacteriota bacterium]